MTIGSSGKFTTVVQSLESKDSKELFAAGWASYLPTEHIVYRANNGALSAVAFDLDRLEVKDASVPIVENVRQYVVSDNGTLVYIPGASALSSKRDLVWIDREGNEEPLSAPPDDYRFVRISPDGTRIALTISSQNNEDIYIGDIAGENMMQLTFDEAADSFPLWTADSKRIIFASSRNSSNGIYVKNADGTGEVELLSNENALPTSLSSDGKTLILIKGGDIGMLNIEGDKDIKLLLQEKYTETVPLISPDGKWIAYMSDELGTYGIYVRPFPNVNGGKWRVSTGLGLMQRWSWDGRELYYWTQTGVMAVPVEADSTFKWKTPKMLFQRSPFVSESMGNTGISWDNHPDGKRFLFIAPDEIPDNESTSTPRSKINIVLNWFEELKERVPVD